MGERNRVGILQNVMMSLKKIRKLPEPEYWLYLGYANLNKYDLSMTLSALFKIG